MFEKLQVYQRSLDLAEDVVRATRGFKAGNREIADQLKRAVVSIPLNIAEGNGRWHEKERKSLFLVARGSAFECVALVELCRKLELVPENEAESWRSDLTEISKMIGGLIKGIETKRRH